jgi:hypothetical protein
MCVDLFDNFPVTRALDGGLMKPGIYGRHECRDTSHESSGSCCVRQSVHGSRGRNNMVILHCCQQPTQIFNLRRKKYEPFHHHSISSALSPPPQSLQHTTLPPKQQPPQPPSAQYPPKDHTPTQHHVSPSSPPHSSPTPPPTHTARASKTSPHVSPPESSCTASHRPPALIQSRKAPSHCAVNSSSKAPYFFGRTVFTHRPENIKGSICTSAKGGLGPAYGMPRKERGAVLMRVGRLRMPRISALGVMVFYVRSRGSVE